MVKDDLKVKIKKVVFWTLGGVLLYLVISFFLLSDYPMHFYHFDHKKTYEVLKDALSIAAAFLAPVAAFILFTDWRYQHSAIKIENTSEAIHKEINVLLNILLNSTKILRNNIFNEEILECEVNLQVNQLNNITPYTYILDKKRYKEEVNIYMNNLDELIKKFLDLNKKFRDISSHYQYLLHETDEEVLKNMRENIRYKILKDLNEIRDELMDIHFIDIFQLHQKSKSFNL